MNRLGFSAVTSSESRTVQPAPTGVPIVRTTIHIDSRDRDYVKYPSESQFVINLPETLNSVSRAVLVCSELPLSYYVFTAARGNTTLKVSLNGTTKSITIPDGNYGTASMTSTLQTALNAAFSPASFTVTFNSQTMKFTISSCW